MDDSESSSNVGADDDATTDRSLDSGDEVEVGGVDDDESVGDRDGADDVESVGERDGADDDESVGDRDEADDAGAADASTELAGDGDETTEELPGPPLGETRTLNPRIQLLWSVQIVVLAALAGGLAWVGTRFDLLPTWVVPVVVGVALVGGGLLVRARYRRWSYEVREDALYLDRGVVTQVRTVVPLVRVQHTDTARGPVERALGLANTVVYTAGSRGADVTVPGLTHDDADELQRLLKRLAVDSAAEDAV